MNSASPNYQNPILTSSTEFQDSPASAVSWGAILAGAAGAAALSLILLILGSGIGLSSVSPWSNSGVGAKTLGVSTIVWIIFTQLTAALLGGYIAGRMRTRWKNVQADEVYFRDTAHGFLTWSIATLFTAALLTSTISSLLGGAAETTLSALSSPLSKPVKRGAEDLATGGTRYQLDKLFRIPTGSITNGPAASVAMPGTDSEIALRSANPDIARISLEVERIFAHTQSRDGKASAALASDDLSYVTGLVEQQTGLSYTDAENRVINSYSFGLAQASEFKTTAQVLADKTRKSAAHASLWLFISLLIGAFVASLGATIGAKHRDD